MTDLQELEYPVSGPGRSEISENPGAISTGNIDFSKHNIFLKHCIHDCEKNLYYILL